jgi:hypothetical protein
MKSERAGEETAPGRAGPLPAAGTKADGREKSKIQFAKSKEISKSKAQAHDELWQTNRVAMEIRCPDRGENGEARVRPKADSWFEFHSNVGFAGGGAAARGAVLERRLAAGFGRVAIKPGFKHWMQLDGVSRSKTGAPVRVLRRAYVSRIQQFAWTYPRPPAGIVRWNVISPAARPKIGLSISLPNTPPPLNCPTTFLICT